MMRISRRIAGISALLCLSLTYIARAEDPAAQIYADILNGEYAAGRAAAAKAVQDDQNDSAAKRVLGWLDSYDTLSGSRAKLRAESLQWNVDQARKADTDGKLYLALTFAARASEYAEKKSEFAKQDWVKSIMDRALAKAKELEGVPKWRDALSYYLRVEQIREKDDGIKKLREHAGRHARLEMLYPDKKAVDRRMEGVRKEMFTESLRTIDRLYYKNPDYRAMALAALENVETLYQTPKLFDVFDGLGNPDTRQKFIDGLKDRRRQVEDRESMTRKELQKFAEDLFDLNRKTVDLPEGLIVVEFLDGAITKLDDFTSMIWPADSVEFDKMLTGDFCGVGISLGVDELSNRLKVVSPLEDSPALEAGVLPNDLIIEVDGESTKDWTTEDAVRRITGTPKTKVKLAIFRPSTGQKLDFPLVRRPIHLRSVEGVSRIKDEPSKWNYIIDNSDGIAYIRLNSFSPSSNDEMTAALDTAQQQGMKGLILDLRYNPGGLLEAAVDIVGKFMNKGRVVTTRGRPDGPERTEHYDVEGRAAFANLPVVVLVNESSASASEILSGAFHDHGRAMILGERTFGKGSVQKVIPLEGARIKLTTALYYLPSGRSPHRSPDADVWGVDPDLKIALTPKEMVKVVERRRDSTILRKSDESKSAEISEEERKANLAALKADKKSLDDDDEPLLTEADIATIESDPTKAPDTDPQLESALLQLRAKLASNMPWPKVASQLGNVKK